LEVARAAQFVLISIVPQLYLKDQLSSIIKRRLCPVRQLYLRLEFPTGHPKDGNNSAAGAVFFSMIYTYNSFSFIAIYLSSDDIS
jgi:hypothetical protein